MKCAGGQRMNRKRGKSNTPLKKAASLNRMCLHTHLLTELPGCVVLVYVLWRRRGGKGV